MTLTLAFLPAAEGDAIWITWGPEGRHRMVVDMGRTSTGRAVRARLDDLPSDPARVELLVVTHVDADHIEGVLSGLIEVPAIERETFGDVWFNGRAHLDGERVAAPGSDRTEAMGPRQGDLLSRWLEPGRWNEAFARGPVVRTDPLTSVTLAGGMRVTVLGPTREGLRRLIPTWDREVASVEGRREPADRPDSKIQSLGAADPPSRPMLHTWDDVDLEAARDTTDDRRAANGTSICLVLECEGFRVLLTGDAHPNDVCAGVISFAAQQDPALPTPVPFDVVKVAHHGSAGNLSDALIRTVSCPTWVFSTNGTRHHHPHAPAVARLVQRHREPRPHLVFNVPSTFNRWWTEGPWPDQFDYTAECGSERQGVTVTLPGLHEGR